MPTLQDIQTFVLNSGPQTKATATTGTDTYQYVFQERRQILGMELRVGHAFSFPLLVGAVVETIAEVSSQALGLTEGVIMTESCEVTGASIEATVAGGTNVLWQDRVRHARLMFPEGYADVFDRGEGIYLHHWWNNGSGGNQIIHAYVIFYYIE